MRDFIPFIQILFILLGIATVVDLILRTLCYLPNTLRKATGIFRDAFGRKKPEDDEPVTITPYAFGEDGTPPEFKTAGLVALNLEQLRTYVSSVIASDPDATPLERGTTIHETISTVVTELPPQVGDIVIVGPPRTFLFPKEGTELLVALRSSTNFDATDSAGNYFPYFDDNALNSGQTYSLKCRAADVPAKDVPAKDVPAKDVPAKDVPAKDVPAKDVPAKDVLVEPAKDVLVEPAKDVLVEPAKEPELPPQVGDTIVVNESLNGLYPPTGTELRVVERENSSRFRAAADGERSRGFFDDNEYNIAATYSLKCRAADVLVKDVSATTPAVPELPPQTGDIIVVGEIKRDPCSSYCKTACPLSPEGTEFVVLRRLVDDLGFYITRADGREKFFYDDNALNTCQTYRLKCRANAAPTKETEPYKPQPGDTIKVKAPHLYARPEEGTILTVTRRLENYGFFAGDDLYYNDDNKNNLGQKYELVLKALKASDVSAEPAKASDVSAEPAKASDVSAEPARASDALTKASDILPPQVGDVIVAGEPTYKHDSHVAGAEATVIRRDVNRASCFWAADSSGKELFYYDDNKKNLAQHYTLKCRAADVLPQVGDVIIAGKPKTTWGHALEGEELRVVRRANTCFWASGGANKKFLFNDDNTYNVGQEYTLKCRVKDVPTPAAAEPTPAAPVSTEPTKDVPVKEAEPYKPQPGDTIKVARPAYRNSGFPRAGTKMKVIYRAWSNDRFYTRAPGGPELLFCDDNKNNSIQKYALLKPARKDGRKSARKDGRKSAPKPTVKGRTRRAAR